MNINDRIQQIKTQLIGATGKKVLLVEGSDDVSAFRIFLSHRPQAADWEKEWDLAEAGNKRAVLSMLKREPTWLGIVDRDESTEADRTAAIKDIPNLIFLPRFCLESYLVDPLEIWPALGPIQQAKILGGLTELEQAVMAHRTKWVRHAALWHTINPLWNTLRAQGFKEGVLDPTQPLSDSELSAILKGWHNTLDAAVVLKDVKTCETALSNMTNSELLTKWIYAKKFYPMVMHAALNQLLGQMTEKDRRLKLLRHMAEITVPSDLEPLWLAMKV